MTINELKLFTKPIENLVSCNLSSQISEESALSLSLILASSDPWLTLNISAKSLENYFIKKDYGLHRYLVLVEDKIAGTICIRFPWLRGPYIELLGLDSKYRGFGIGKQLLEWVEKEARRESKNLWVVSSSFNHKAIQFYEKQGFSKIGVIQGLIKPNYDEMLLRKSWD